MNQYLEIYFDEYQIGGVNQYLEIYFDEYQICLLKSFYLFFVTDTGITPMKTDVGLELLKKKKKNVWCACYSQSAPFPSWQ